MKTKKLLAGILSMSLMLSSGVQYISADEISEMITFERSDTKTFYDTGVYSGNPGIKEFVPDYSEDIRYGIGYSIDNSAGNGKIVTGSEFFIDETGCPRYYTLLREYTDVLIDGELPVDEINEELEGAVFSKTEKGYRITSEMPSAYSDAIDVLKKYGKIIRLTNIYSWNKTKWENKEFNVVPKSKNLDEIKEMLSVFGEIESVGSSDVGKKFTKIVLSEGFSSETKFTDEQKETLLELLKGTSYAFSIRPVVSETERIGMYAVDTYNTDLSLGVNQNLFLEYNEIIEVRRTDGSVVTRFAGSFSPIIRVDSLPEKLEYNKFYSVEGEDTYLACLGYGDKIVKYTDFVYTEPRYYFDNKNSTINYCETGEEISRLYGYTTINSSSNRLDGVYWIYEGNDIYGCLEEASSIGLSDYYSVESDNSANDQDLSEKITEDISYGDLDADNTVDLSDLTILSQYILKDIELSAFPVKCADVNADNEVNVQDLALLKQYIMHDNVKFGISEAKPEKEKATMTATVKEVYGMGMLVVPVEGSPELRSADLINVGYSEKITFVKPGDLVEVDYDGAILESYPAQIYCFEIRVI